MAGFSNKIQVILDVTADKAVTSMRGFRSSVREADGAVNKFKAGGSAAMSSVKANAAALAISGGAALVTFGVKSVKAFQETALAAGKFADATGVGVEAASRWREVGSDIGVDSGVIQSAFNKMNKTLGATPEKFDEYGVAVTRAADGTTDVSATFLNLVDRLNAIADPAERAKVASELLGKGWTGMAELIAQGSDGLRDSLASVSDAQVIDPEEEAKAKKTRAALDDLSDALEGFMIEVGDAVSGLIPLGVELLKLTGYATDFIGIATGGDAKSMSKPLEAFTAAAAEAGDSGALLLNAFTDLAGESGLARSSLDKTGAVIEGVFGKDKGDTRLDNLKKAFRELAAESPENAKRVFDALKNLNSQIGTGNEAVDDWADGWGFTGSVLNDFQGILAGATTATDKNATTTGKAADAADEATTKFGGLKDILSSADEAFDRAGITMDHVADADKAAAEAAERLADRESDVADALQDRIDRTKDLYDEQLSLLDKQEAYIQTTRSLTSDMDDYNATMADGKKTAKEKADATADMSEQIRQAARDFGTLEGAEDSSQESINRQIESLYGMVTTLGPNSPLRSNLLRYIAELQSIPRNVSSTLTLDIKGAHVSGGSIADSSLRNALEDRGYPAVQKGSGFITQDAPDVDQSDQYGSGFILQDAGRVQNISHTSSPANAPDAVDPQDAIRAQDDLQAAMFETSDIGLDTYRDYLKGREADEVKWSAEWLDIHRKIGALTQQEADEAKRLADEKQAEIDLITQRENEAAQWQLDQADRVQKYLFDSGQITLDQYKDYLNGRRSKLLEYSAESIDLWGQIHGLEVDAAAAKQKIIDDAADEAKKKADDAEKAEKKRADDAREAEEKATKDHLDRIQDLFDDARERKAYGDAVAGVEGAMGDLGAAVGASKVKGLSAEDRQAALVDLEQAKQKAAEALYKRADAGANAAGIDDGTPEWASSVRLALLGDKVNAPALAGYIDNILSGIPMFAKGGVMPGPRGQHSLALVAGGERVLTEGQQAASAPVYIDLRGAVGVDGPAVERWVVGVLKNHERKNGLNVYRQR